MYEVSYKILTLVAGNGMMFVQSVIEIHFLVPSGTHMDVTL
jgi:hypothetical protein